jgi:hypothetical protein
MKHLATFLNEEQYATFINKAKELELSEYALLKKILLDYLHGDAPNSQDDVAHLYSKKVKMLKHQRKWALAMIFVLSLYFVASLTYILLFRFGFC